MFAVVEHNTSRLQLFVTYKKPQLSKIKENEIFYNLNLASQKKFIIN